MDRITLIGVSAKGFHGVRDFERKDGQTFIIDVTIWIDHTKAAITDDLENTVSYSDVGNIIKENIENDPVNLIEKLATRIADQIMRLYDSISAIEVTVHKPNAPLKVTFEDVMVVKRKSRKVLTKQDQQYLILSLGSNLPNRIGSSPEIIAQAINQIPGVLDVSPLYKNKKWDLNVSESAQPEYFNCVIKVDPSNWTEYQWLNHIHLLETSSSRPHPDNPNRGVNLSRTLDIDIITTNPEKISDNKKLTLPHKYADQRLFVLTPWFDIDPQAKLNNIPIVSIIDNLLKNESPLDPPVSLWTNNSWEEISK